MPEKDLNELFLDTLKDIYYAEKQILKTLPKMAKAAQSEKLQAAFEKHHDETEGQIERLEQVFELIGKPARGKRCDAIEGIIEEGKEIMSEYKGTPALDAGLLAAAQAVEHYEMSRYGTLKAWALKLNIPQAAKLLDQTLNEETEDRRNANQDRGDSGQLRSRRLSRGFVRPSSPHRRRQRRNQRWRRCHESHLQELPGADRRSFRAAMRSATGWSRASP